MQNKETFMDNYEFKINPENEIVVKRQLFGKTQKDIEIESLKVPQRPIWLRVTVKSIRFYQAHISERLGNRCVFDPSCSIILKWHSGRKVL